MKHNTHIYVAAKAVEFMHSSIDNLRNYPGGKQATSKRKSEVRALAKELRRLLDYHKELTIEAAWAPDDILKDMQQYHTFKLFTDAEFKDAGKFVKQTYRQKYYRASGSGGAPYKVDHLSRIVADLGKFRDYNDAFDMRQIMYLYFVISHYVVDANVPMHCDLRDDPPSAKNKTKPKQGKYLDKNIHGDMETWWEAATTEVAEQENIPLEPNYKYLGTPDKDLMKAVTFEWEKKKAPACIQPYSIKDGDLMDFMIDLCIRTKDRSLDFFPINDPLKWDRKRLPGVTRDIFSEAISTLISVWLWIWEKQKNEKKK